MRGLLALLREKPALVEADLRRFYGVAIGDLWRFDALGCRRLTYRQIFVYICNLPRDSALAIDANGGTTPWSPTDHLIADLWALKRNEGRKQTQRAKDHPGRPKPKRDTERGPEWEASMRAARRRRRDRLRAQSSRPRRPVQPQPRLPVEV